MFHLRVCFTHQELFVCNFTKVLRTLNYVVVKKETFQHCGKILEALQLQRRQGTLESYQEAVNSLYVLFTYALS